MGRTPVKARKSKKALVGSSLDALADSKFLRCPKGHGLPHKTDKGRCTPLSCAETSGDLTRVRVDKIEDPEERVTKVAGDEELRVKVQSARKEVWNKFLGIPMDLKGAEAEKYADDELQSMLPFAIGVVKKQLLYGTEEQQERAADRVLKATGKSAKEAAASMAPTMVIQMAPGTKFEFPWAPKTVNGEVVKSPALPETTDEKK